MIHRDVKPSNILITRSGDPMLTDFGIAKILEATDAQTLTGTGMGVGTPEYMAPEQWTGGTGAAADIYSLGVVLYELVTGRKPYTADTPAAVLLKQASEPLPAPKQFVPGLPDVVEKTIFKALARKPEDRFPDMAGFASALGGLLGGSPGEIHPKMKTEDETGINSTRLQLDMDSSMSTIDQGGIPEVEQKKAAYTDVALPKPEKPAPPPAPPPAAPLSTSKPRRKMPVWAWALIAVAVLVPTLILLGPRMTAEQYDALNMPTATLSLPTDEWYAFHMTQTAGVLLGDPCLYVYADFATIDVTIPDNTVLAPGQAFTKTWRLTNAGSCPWTYGYELVYVSGERMGVPENYSQPFTDATIAQGESVDVSVELVAPTTPGTYTGYWRFRAPDGTEFGLGGSNAWWVTIVVANP
jgi:Ig-like domain from next to BRCA1 gene/Protein kinase domain